MELEFLLCTTDNVERGCIYIYCTINSTPKTVMATLGKSSYISIKKKDITFRLNQLKKQEQFRTGAKKRKRERGRESKKGFWTRIGIGKG